jgi:hypothetical protein
MLFFEIPGHKFLDGFGRDRADLKVDILVRLDETGCIATFVPFSESVNAPTILQEVEANTLHSDHIDFVYVGY